MLGKWVLISPATERSRGRTCDIGDFEVFVFGCATQASRRQYGEMFWSLTRFNINN